MYKKLVLVLMLVMLISLFPVPAALATGEPTGSCPPGFTLEEVMPHEHHPHQHVGTSTDKNGDGFICMKHVTPDESIHVHMDNNLP